ncbi:hypothetical protein GGD68_000877 [Paraburkholderia fungorum]|uniref:Uncharacterized protein n=1 Tax=Paraburkholderia fungorum TaxID=134537 RepID=A0AAW3UQQ4_9BURK|nr:hypothetical protein [Paraburkholderia fungorum]MBB6200031.1 hypothetical protein [Paraburkholderia fungorum]PRZ53717.1 hypothetical protein BX589_109157 [Paraburkholderia fungorum]
MNTSYLVGESRPAPRVRRLLWLWIAFWLLMLAVGMQKSLWSGKLLVWQQLVDSCCTPR